MNTRNKKGGKPATFETENTVIVNKTIENNRYWAVYLYQLLLIKDFDLADSLTDCLNQEIGLVRTSKILDLSLLLLESNNPSIYEEYKNRAGIVVIEE